MYFIQNVLSTMYCNRQYICKIHFATIHKQKKQSSGNRCEPSLRRKKKSKIIISASELRNPYYSTLELKSQIF